jgi:P27 family predicted phage terminase small subunit
MPTDLAPDSQRIWRHVVREMRSTGVLRSADRDVLRLYCDAVVRYVGAQKLLADSGPLIQSRDRGLVRNPLHWIVRDNADLVTRLARELLLTPMARLGMPASEEEPAADPFDAWRASGTGT